MRVSLRGGCRGVVDLNDFAIWRLARYPCIQMCCYCDQFCGSPSLPGLVQGALLRLAAAGTVM